MKQRITFGFLIGFLVAVTSLRADSRSLMENAYLEGNQRYANEDFAGAIESYQRAMLGGESANLHFNLGNAYARSGDVGRAVLHYRKALALDPNHVDARTNLILVEDDAGIDIEDRSFLVEWAEHFAVNFWGVLCVSGFWILIVAWVFAPSFRLGARTLALITFLCLIGLGCSGLGLAGYHLMGKQAVVVGEAVSLRVAPTDKSPGSLDVAQGLTVLKKREVNGYVLVDLPDGSEGYLSASDVVPVWD